MAESLREGRFVVLGALGEGSQGKTFDGVDKREGRRSRSSASTCAARSRGRTSSSPSARRACCSRSSHPKLPAVHRPLRGGRRALPRHGEDRGREPGGAAQARATLAEEDVVRLLRDAADVLDYLHGRTPPVIHRDLKPGNVLRRPDGSFAFVDFGAVRDKLRPEGGSTVVGTFGYMAPEQFQGRALPASDVYAIGATAVAMLTGREPEDLPHQGPGHRRARRAAGPGERARSSRRSSACSTRIPTGAPPASRRCSRASTAARAPGASRDRRGPGRRPLRAPAGTPRPAARRAPGTPAAAQELPRSAVPFLARWSRSCSWSRPSRSPWRRRSSSHRAHRALDLLRAARADRGGPRRAGRRAPRRRCDVPCATGARQEAGLEEPRARVEEEAGPRVRVDGTDGAGDEEEDERENRKAGS